MQDHAEHHIDHHEHRHPANITGCQNVPCKPAIPHTTLQEEWSRSATPPYVKYIASGQ